MVYNKKIISRSGVFMKLHYVILLALVFSCSNFSKKRVVASKSLNYDYLSCLIDDSYMIFEGYEKNPYLKLLFSRCWRSDSGNFPELTKHKDEDRTLSLDINLEELESNMKNYILQSHLAAMASNKIIRFYASTESKFRYFKLATDKPGFLFGMDHRDKRFK